MLKQMKKTFGILLVVCFLMSVTAAAVSSEPVVTQEKSVVTKEKNFVAKEKNVVAQEKKKAIVILKDAKTKLFKDHHHSKNITMNRKTGKDMAVKTKQQ